MTPQVTCGIYMYIYICVYIYIYILRVYVFISRQRRLEGEREGEKHQCVVASCTALTGDLARNPGMCPDWEPNP